MRIKGTETTHRNVELTVDDGDVYEALKAKVYQSVGLRPDMYLDSKGRLKYDEDNYHGSPSEILVNENPSEIQVKTIEAFRHIYAMMIRD